VHQRRRLQGMVGTFLPHVMGRKAPQLAVNDGHQPGHCVRMAGPQVQQKRRYVAGVRHGLT
jgi:hypothetical protein